MAAEDAVPSGTAPLAPEQEADIQSKIEWHYSEAERLEQYLAAHPTPSNHLTVGLRATDGRVVRHSSEHRLEEFHTNL